jgi:hypothetical protein
MVGRLNFKRRANKAERSPAFAIGLVEEALRTSATAGFECPASPIQTLPIVTVHSQPRGSAKPVLKV